MDLSEALTFTPTSVIQSSSSPISRNRSGLVHICSTPDSSAIFHYSPQSQRLSYYNHAVTNDPQSNNDIDIAIASIQIQNVIHISCSYDGRMVLAFVGNGSMTCLDVTSSSLSIRWHKDDMHSHTGPYGAGIDTDIDIADRTANCHLGPIHSVQWIPKAGKYTCLYVDAVQGCYLLQCNVRDDDGDGVMAQSLSDLIDEAPSKILVATWEPRYARRIAVGCADGSIGFMTLLMSDDNDGDDDGDGEGSFSWNVTQQNFIVPELVEEEEQEEVRWSVTHLDWFHEWHLAVGFCRVFPDDAGGEYPSDGNDNDDGDDDALDDAQHEANLCIYCEPNLAWMELGDVVAFFGVPKYGRHVFYTQFVWCGEDPVDRDSSFGILLVGCNVTGEIGVVDLDRCDHTMWELCDLQEGNALTAPITDDDEFSVPTGLAVAVNGRNRKIDVLLSATDGSLSVYEFGPCHQ